MEMFLSFYKDKLSCHCARNRWWMATTTERPCSSTHSWCLCCCIHCYSRQRGCQGESFPVSLRNNHSTSSWKRPTDHGMSSTSIPWTNRCQGQPPSTPDETKTSSRFRLWHSRWTIHGLASPQWHSCGRRQTLLFATDNQISLLQTAKTWYADATFHVVRRPIYPTSNCERFCKKRQRNQTTANPHVHNELSSKGRLHCGVAVSERHISTDQTTAISVRCWGGYVESHGICISWCGA